MAVGALVTVVAWSTIDGRGAGVAVLGGGVVGASVGSGVVDGVTEGDFEAPDSVAERTPVVGFVGL